MRSVGDKNIKVTLLKGGGGDTYYELGLLSGLISQGLVVDYIGSDRLKGADVLRDEKVNFYNLRGDQNPNAPLRNKLFRVVNYYFKLMKYSINTNSKLFHIQWPDKFVYFDRSFLNMYYKLLGKKIVFTAHNVNDRVRDGKDTHLNRLSLKIMYNIVDHIIVHTDKMKSQLTSGFNIKEEKVTVIPYGINNMVPNSDLNRAHAREKLQLGREEKTLLFFGNITNYKGLDYLIMALAEFRKNHNNFKLIIAGRISKDSADYWKNIQNLIIQNELRNHIINKIEFIPDRDIEIYFKSADVLILPYNYIFQSGVLFMAYSFGLPVIATDVGSLKEDIIEDSTGYICKPKNHQDLREKIEQYFQSDLYKNSEENRKRIRKYAFEKYSWDRIGKKTYEVYQRLV